MKKVKFRIAGGPAGLAYHAGEEAEFEDLQADELIRQGYCCLPEKDEQVENMLPEDLPAREVLFAAGVKTLDELSGIDDLTSLEGVGKKTAEKIENYLIEQGLR